MDIERIINSLGGYIESLFGRSKKLFSSQKDKMELNDSETELSEMSQEKIICPAKLRSKRIKKQKNFIQMVFFQNLQ